MFQTKTVRDEFLDKVKLSSQSALLLDYDGTLAPFTETRECAPPYADVPSLLAEIMDSTPTRVVIISGRSASEVAGLLALSPAPEIWGAHGMERLQPDGTRTSGRLDRRTMHAINEAEKWAIAQGWGGRVERKPGGVALHWRGLDPAEAENMFERATDAFLPLTRVSRLSMAEFDGGVELRVHHCDKGRVVSRIVSEMQDAPVAYLGDDRTDEDAFRALQGRGLTVLVRPELRPTAAEVWIKPPEELLEFLGEWLYASRGGR